MQKSISVYIINLRKRADRRQHCLAQFRDKSEFSVTFVEAVENPEGNMGLWLTLTHIFHDLVGDQDEFVIIAEDDVLFTSDYSLGTLKASIHQAEQLGADLVCGGVSWMSTCFPVSSDLFWVEKFSGLQFTIIFKKFYQQLLTANFEVWESADYKMASLTHKTYFIFPFITIQKDFGYSDVTRSNNFRFVEDLFTDVSHNISVLSQIWSFYFNSSKTLNDTCRNMSLTEITIPTYILNFSSLRGSRARLESEFALKNEFDVHYVDAYAQCIDDNEIWKGVRSAVNTAIMNDEDVIIICHRPHFFTKAYSKEFFFQEIFHSHLLGAELLCGGLYSFDQIVPITSNKLWVSAVKGSHLVVLYKSVFDRVMEEPCGIGFTVDEMYSRISDNKMMLYPFISTMGDYESLTGKTIAKNEVIEVANWADNSDLRLRKILSASTESAFERKQND